MYFSCWNSWEINFLFFQAFLNYLGSRYNFSFNYKRISAFYVKLCSFSTNCEVWIKSPKILLLVHPHGKVSLWWHCVPLLYYTHTHKRTKMTFLPSLIQVSMVMLGQMRETHTQMEYQCSSLYCSISISATECYNFISKELIDTVILYSQMCKRKCNITALFLRAPNVGTWLNLNGNSI